MLAEEEVAQTMKWNKIEAVFDKRLVVASAQPSTHPTSRGAPIVLPDYSQTDQTQRMWLLPVVQAGAMRWLSAEQAVVAAASGTAIGRAQYSRAAVPEAHAS